MEEENLGVPGRRYANYIKVGHNRYEFLFEFGQMFQEDETPHLDEQIVTSPPYAKAFLRTLEESVQQFEAKFGEIPELKDEG
jgi:hypothetical protein